MNVSRWRHDEGQCVVDWWAVHGRMDRLVDGWKSAMLVSQLWCPKWSISSWKSAKARICERKTATFAPQFFVSYEKQTYSLSDQTECPTCVCEWRCDLHHCGHDKRAKVDFWHINISCLCERIIWLSDVTEGVGLEQHSSVPGFTGRIVTLRSLPPPKCAPSLALFPTVGTIVRMQMRGYSFQIQWEQCFMYLRPTYINGAFFCLDTDRASAAHILS